MAQSQLRNSFLNKRNPIAKDLRTPKYKKRIIKSKKIYNRKDYKK
jgi:hypothetical protein|tara:strand:+ start:53 stop:187 length:135 start_codon:yes stop_codon:yes gene_type:complete